MKGNITKRHVVAVARVLGFRTAIRLLLSSRPVALQILVGGLK